MIRKTLDSSAHSDVIQRCDSLLKNNIDEFYNYAKHQETFRLQLITTNDEYKNLKTCLDTAYDDIISLKSKQCELLLENSVVLEFFHYMNDLETLRLKFVETINEYKNLKRTVDTVNKDIVLLKSEYNDSSRGCEELSKKNIAKELIDYGEQQAKLRLKFIDVINRCERLISSIYVAFEDIVVLNEKHDDLKKRYRELSANKTVEEFLVYAKNQTTVRSKRTEMTDKCKCSEAGQHRPSKDTASLNSQLTEALETLNSERLRYEKIKSERDSLEYLSEGFCRLLLKHKCGKSSDEVEHGNATISKSSQKSANGEAALSDQLNTIAESGSSSDPEMNILPPVAVFNETIRDDKSQLLYLREDANEPTVVKREKSDALDNLNKTNSRNDVDCENQAYLNENHEESAEEESKIPDTTPAIFTPSEFSCHFMDTEDISDKNCDTTTLSLETSEEHGSIIQNNVPKRQRLRNRIKKPHSKIKASKSTKKSRPSQQDTDVEEESFYCSECGKSFIVKPNERIPQYCPICNINNCGPKKSTIMHESGSSTIFNNEFSGPCCCNICGRYFANAFYLNQHKRTAVHAKQNTYKCLVCNQHFTSKYLLKRHTLSHYPELSSFCCLHCGKRCRSKKGVLRHLHLQHFHIQG